MLILSYDISDNKLRTKFAKYLKRYGRRLQYSVWELKNSDRILNMILLYIKHKFAKSFENSDSIIIFSLCEGCKKKVIRYGYSVQEEQEILFV